eukprot:939763-Pelagomonas_calceolata.AAC.4
MGTAKAGFKECIHTRAHAMRTRTGGGQCAIREEEDEARGKKMLCTFVMWRTIKGMQHTPHTGNKGSKKG